MKLLLVLLSVTPLLAFQNVKQQVTKPLTQLDALVAPRQMYNRPGGMYKNRIVNNRGYYGAPTMRPFRGGREFYNPPPINRMNYGPRYGYQAYNNVRPFSMQRSYATPDYYDGPMSRNNYRLADEYGMNGYNNYRSYNNNYYGGGRNNAYMRNNMMRGGYGYGGGNIMGSNTGMGLPYEYGMNYDKSWRMNDGRYFRGHHNLQGGRFGASHRNLLNNNSSQRWNSLAQEYGMDYESSRGRYGGFSPYVRNDYTRYNDYGYGSDRRMMNRYRSMPMGNSLTRSPYSSLGLNASGGTYNGNVDWSGLASEYGMSRTRY